MDTVKSHNQIINNDVTTDVAVVILPLPAQGHLNQLLHLSRLMSAYDIPIHFASTTTHIRQAKTRVHGWDPKTVANIHFHELPIPLFSNPPPNPDYRNQFPPHMLPMIEALPNLREPFVSLVQKLSEQGKSRKIALIYDIMMGHVVQDVRSLPNVKSYNFYSISAFSILSLYWEMAGRPNHADQAEVQLALNETPSMEETFGPEISELMMKQSSFPPLHIGELYNTTRVLEELSLDMVAKENQQHKLMWAIGPLNPLMIHHKKEEDVVNSINDGGRRHNCLHWLDKQENGSVLFVSFGTTCSLSDEQISELAFGLERSGQKFVWVLRDADRGDVFDGEARRAPLPQGFEERVEGRGIVVRDWAPQVEILGHTSIGGFITHCGWNSCIESISHGVPMGTWPMHSDQPANAVLLNKMLKIGVEVRPWASRNEVLSSSKVEEAVRKLMASAEGEEMRKRASELGDAVRKSVLEGGASRKEMDSFILHITE